tara:strand:- start:540 stop:1583 length:1044 start_codon:yes stop_codon:yes gene_type:complete
MKEKNIFFHKDFDYFKSEKFSDIGRRNNYIYDNLYIDYKKFCFPDNRYNNLSFQMEGNNNLIYCPITLESKKDEEKNINFFGEPFLIINKNIIENDHKKILHNVFQDFKKKYSIKNFLFKFQIIEEDIKKSLNEEKKSIDLIHSESRINLKNSLEKIFNDFSKGHKSSLKTEYPELKYELFDYKNYFKKQIFEMMGLHEIVSKQKSRSEKTWEVMEKMILDKKGFLIKVKNKDKLISYSFFFHNTYTSYYFSSCTVRENFKTFNNITHKTIWLALEHLKKIGCSYLHLGSTKTIYSSKNNWITKIYNLNDKEAEKFQQKEVKVQRFKSSFGGEKNYFITYKDIPKEF